MLALIGLSAAAPAGPRPKPSDAEVAPFVKGLKYKPMTYYVKPCKLYVLGSGNTSFAFCSLMIGGIMMDLDTFPAPGDNSGTLFYGTESQFPDSKVQLKYLKVSGSCFD